ncbi:hypothetical protein OHB12_33990 [Nocardia sp. NBC_01730]|uniref:hypothetical protein n=1 Tax=Nocardia sp. NBC_01730 TaxID=2975998 RepID=UPI002E15CF3F|nr:hypothetical protein OHB12_33990 [Nocardia sp. NBC_01730]
MRRTTAALAASATLFALLLAGCGNDEASSGSPSTTSGAPSAQGGEAQAFNGVQAGVFVVNFRGAFPKLAEGKDDAKIASILSEGCKDIKAGKSEDEVVENITKRAGGSTEPSSEEAEAIYHMAKLMC